MTDREKIINAIEKAKKQSEEYAQDRIIVPFKEADMILAMLKEQDKSRLEIAHEMVTGSILMYQGKEVVRCHDCKHRPVKPDNYKNGFDLEFPDGKCPCQCNDGYYSWYPNDNWFCADGERKEGR